jgi:hypothetical protein
MARQKHFPYTASEADLAYMAGLIDGEGSVYAMGFKNNKGYWAFQTYIQCVNNHIPVIKWCADTFGGRAAPIPEGSLSANGRFHPYKWVADGPNSTHIARLLLPYSRIKKPQLELYIELRELMEPGRGNRPIQDHELDARQSLIKRMKALNGR